MASILSRAALRHMFANTQQRAVSHAATAGGHEGGYLLWKRLSFFVAFPAVGLAMLNAYLKHHEEHDKPAPEFVPYEYLRVRTKRFPWGEGNKSLFHNPHLNALPNGYEEH